jgi:hypothetical protein
MENITQVISTHELLRNAKFTRRSLKEEYDVLQNERYTIIRNFNDFYKNFASEYWEGKIEKSLLDSVNFLSIYSLRAGIKKQTKMQTLQNLLNENKKQRKIVMYKFKELKTAVQHLRNLKSSGK